jgi:hypothetical protein
LAFIAASAAASVASAGDSTPWSMAPANNSSRATGQKAAESLAPRRPARQRQHHEGAPSGSHRIGDGGEIPSIEGSERGLVNGEKKGRL